MWIVCTAVRKVLEIQKQVQIPFYSCGYATEAGSYYIHSSATEMVLALHEVMPLSLPEAGLVSLVFN
jgi:hypothetical protein